MTAMAFTVWSSDAALRLWAWRNFGSPLCSPWQSPYVERLMGSVRRECLDHVIVLNQVHLHRLLKAYFAYYHRSRTHLGLDKDAPEPRPVQGPEEGKVVAFPQVGGLHHRYERLAA